MANSTKLILDAFSELGKQLGDRFYFTGLKDCPSIYVGHSGDYLVVNDDENGISFTGIENIANDLIDYGFSAGETTFTGLRDTPDDFNAGKYLRVNDAGDALEYVDITDTSSGGTSRGGIGSHPSVIEKSNFSELIPDRINVPITRGSNTFNEQERYFHFEGFFTNSSNIDMIQYEWNIGAEPRFIINFKNNANGDFYEYNETNDTSNTDIDFSRIPSAITNQPTLKEFIDANRAIYLGGGSSNYEFCRSAFSSSSTIGHANSSLDLDPNQLTTNSQDWTYTDTNLNVVGIKIPEDGLYNLNFHIAVGVSNTSSTFPHWMNNISLFRGTLHCVKPDGTTKILLSKDESKNAGNGVFISVDLAQDNEYLEAGDFLYINSRVYDNTASSTTFPVEGKSFFSISKAGAGGGGSGSVPQFCNLGGLNTTQSLSHDTPKIVDFDVNINTGSQNWKTFNTDLGANVIEPGEAGYYNINAAVGIEALNDASDMADVRYAIMRIKKYNKTTQSDSVIIRDHVGKSIGDTYRLHLKASIDNYYLEADEVLFLEAQIHKTANTNLTEHAINTSYLNTIFQVERAGAGGSGSSGGSTDFISLTDTPVDYIGHSGDYMIVNDDENSIHFTGIEKIAQDLTDYGFAGGGGTSYFTGLLDTPTGYLNHSGKYLIVNDDENGLEFITRDEILGIDSVNGYDFCSDLLLQSDYEDGSATFENLSVIPLNVSSQNTRHSTTITPIYGQSSFHFDGNSLLSIGYEDSFKVISSKTIPNFTIQFWIYLNTELTEQPVIGNANNNNNHGFNLKLLDDNKVQFNVCKGTTNNTSVTLTSNNALTASNWHHVALVNENNFLTFYIDGVSSGSVEWTEAGTNTDPSIPVQIGALSFDNNSINYLNAYLQDIRIDRTAFDPSYFPPQELSNSNCFNNNSPYTLLSLKDTPINYSNAGGKYLRVNEAESQVEFVGISIEGTTNNQFSTAYVTGDINFDSLVNEFNFGGLDIGKTYRMSTTVCLNADSSSDFPKVDFYNGDNKIVSLFSKGSTSTVSNSMLFIATDTNLFASGRDLTSTAYIMGDPEISFLQLELPPSVTVDLTEDPLPIPGAGGGVFRISDVKVNSVIDDSNERIDMAQILGEDDTLQISNIQLQANVDNATGESFDLDPYDVLYDVTDIKLHTNIDNPTGESSDLDIFSVLYDMTDLKIHTNIDYTGIDDQTNTFPTEAFDWEI